MKVLWITNHPIGDLVKEIDKNHTSGTWMDPTLNDVKKIDGLRIGIATVAQIKKPFQFSKDGVDYYCLPKDNSPVYRYKNRKNLSMWKQIIDDFKPDALHLWGTEYAYGRCAQEAAPNVPSVIVMQGMVDSIDRFYLGGMSAQEVRHAYSIRNFIKRDSLLQQQKIYHKRAKAEREMIALSGNVIVDAEWAKGYCTYIYPPCKMHTFKTNINKLFFDRKWKAEQTDKNTIMCTSPVGYPLKGFHNMLKAMAIIKDKYPELKLRVPGIENPLTSDLKTKFKQSGYMKYICRLIKDNNLEDRITFMGRLTSEQMASELEKARIYIVPSVIEYQSMSLRESMAVGTPCIASFAGGMPEMVRHGVNGYLYRPEEYEQLAYRLGTLLSEDMEKLKEVSENARKDIREYYSTSSDGVTLTNIYKRISKKG